LLQKLKRRRETWCPGKAQESVQDAAGGYFLLLYLRLLFFSTIKFGLL
jgi:hypothetical protein